MAGNIETAKDLGQGVYTQAEVDSELDAKSDVATTLNGYGITDSYTKTEVNDKPTGFKNYIINGGFDVWQRGTSFTGLGAANNYTADRFVARTYGTNGTVNVTKVSSVTISTPLLRFETVNTDGLGAYYIEQKVENPSQFKNKTMTFSAKVRNISGYSGKNIKINIYLLTTTGYVHINTSLATLSLTNEFQTISGTHTFDNMSSYVFDESSHLLFRLELEDKNINGTIDIAQVQLEEGSVATPFEQRPYGLELSLCQRYYTRAYNTTPHHIGFVFNNNQVSVSSLSFPVEMRTTPSFTVVKPSHITTAGNWGIYGATNGWSSTGYTPSFSSCNSHSVQIQFSGVLGLSNGSSYICSGGFIADAEL